MLLWILAASASTRLHTLPPGGASLPGRPELTQGASQIPEVVAPWEPDEAMKAWAREHVPAYGSEDERMRMLLAHLSRRDLVYDATYTGTAREVFESGRFNCLGLSHLMVGLGRELGVETYYVRVTEYRTYHRRDELLLVSTHVAAAWGPSTHVQLVDMEPVTDRDRRMADPIPDSEALALHHTNRGAESLMRRDPERAMLWLDRALAIQPVPEAFVNRGVALGWLGDLAGAAASYERALELDPDSLSAWRNLAEVRSALGERDVGRAMMEELDRRDNTNPYTWLALGDLALQGGDLGDARRMYAHARYLSRGNPDVLRAFARHAEARGDEPRAASLLARAQRRESLLERLSSDRPQAETGSVVDR
jgi:tetratricopeptide (TPR) repeat protein